MKINNETNLWVERYRPQTVNDCILPDRIKSIFNKFIEDGETQSLMLCGTQGTGKTTVAKALCEQLGCDYMIINASLENGIDSIRTTINSFASSVSIDKTGLKVVIMDEADGISIQAQGGLRAFIESFYDNCRFIFTCNNKNKMIAPLQSRCTVVDFTFTPEEKPKMQTQLFRRCCQILIDNEIKFEKPVIAELVKTYYPDFRRMLNELQRFSTSGEINSSILASIGDTNIDNLVKMIKEKKFTEMSKWVADNEDVDLSSFLDELEAKLKLVVEPCSIPDIPLILNDLQRDSFMVVNQRINMIAHLTEAMANLRFK